MNAMLLENRLLETPGFPFCHSSNERERCAKVGLIGQTIVIYERACGSYKSNESKAKMEQSKAKMLCNIFLLIDVSN